MVDLNRKKTNKRNKDSKTAKAAGELAPQQDCKALAAFFWIGWEGAVLRAKLERSAAPLAVFAEGFFASIRT